MKRHVNITFQVMTPISNKWDEAPIIYVLENVPVDEDISTLLNCISVIHNFATVRSTKLFLSDPVTIKVVCRNNANYYQAKPTFYNKIKE